MTKVWKRPIADISPRDKQRSMAATYYFLSAPNDHGVLDWFRSQTETAEKHSNEVRVLLHYCQFGALAQNADRSFDPSRSPIVSIFFPKVRRGALWTVGEVHFTYKSKEFPALERLRKRFQAWINAAQQFGNGSMMAAKLTDTISMARSKILRMSYSRCLRG
jgi:hypothetical protein